MYRDSNKQGVHDFLQKQSFSNVLENNYYKMKFKGNKTLKQALP